jgi:hypothetical protein
VAMRHGENGRLPDMVAPGKRQAWMALRHHR